MGAFRKETNPFEYGATNNSWITAYKDAVFYSCIREGYKNDSIWFLMSKEDWFNPYDRMANGNLVTAFLGSYNTKVTISSSPNGYQLNFQVSNTSSWESATRFRIDNDGNGIHDGVFLILQELIIVILVLEEILLKIGIGLNLYIKQYEKKCNYFFNCNLLNLLWRRVWN